MIEERRYYVPETGRFRDFYFLTREGIAKAEELQEEIGKRKVKVRERDELRELKISELLGYLKKTAKKPIEPGRSYLVKGEKPDMAYEVFKRLLEERYEGVVISDHSPRKIREKYGLRAESFWLSEVEGENILKPDRLDFEIMATISNFLKENDKPVIMLEGFEYLSQVNGFDQCLKWVKTTTDIVAKNDGILILPINPVVFSEKEISLLTQIIEVYEPGKIAPVEINYTNIIKNITPEGFIDLRTILEPKRFIDYSERRPEVRYFFGREKELKALYEFLKSRSKVLCIKGIAGIGKSVLASKFIESIEMNVFWHRFYEFTTLRNLFSKFSEFLVKLERTKLRNCLDREKFDLEELLAVLGEEIKGTLSLLVFDDIQKANQDIINFLSSFKDLVEDSKIIVIGRTIPSFYDRRDVVIKKIVTELTLGGLDRDDSYKLLAKRGVKKEEHERLYKLTGGHPLSLELVTAETREEMGKFFREEILKRLDVGERKALELASVFRCPFDAKAMLDADIEPDIIDSLVEKSLLDRYIDAYSLHEVIKMVVYKTLSHSQKMGYHRAAGMYYKEKREDQAKIEAMFHFLKAKDYESALNLVFREAPDLISKKYWEECRDILKEFDEAFIDKMDWSKLLLLKGDVSAMLETWEKALSYYSASLEIYEKLGDRLKVAELHKKIASVEKQRGKWYEAMKNYMKSLHASNRATVPELTKLQKSLQIFYWERDKEKLPEYVLALPSIKKYKDPWVLAFTFIELGNTYGERGEGDKALEYYEKSLKVLEKVENASELARAYKGMGDVYLKKLDLNRAIDCFEKCRRYAERIGNKFLTGRSLLSLGEIHLKKGDRDRAKEYLDKSLAVLKRIDDKLGIQAVNKLYREIGNSVTQVLP
ncbi:MAG: DUF835 domain-containing protein [Candidatus Thermoplasmatota archaeon]|nr:DUF835 domain-containing protein [Candidatus Thermoplasmatota archaeon]